MGTVVMFIVACGSIMFAGVYIGDALSTLTGVLRQLVNEATHLRETQEKMNNNIVGVGRQLEEYNAEFKGMTNTVRRMSDNSPE